MSKYIGGIAPASAGTQPTAQGRSGDDNDDDVVAIPIRHPWRWVTAAVLLIIFVNVAVSLLVNKNLDHATIADYIFNPQILAGVELTVVLTVVGMIISTVLAVILAVMRLSTNPVLNVLAWLYIWIFRGTPLLVQIVFWGFLGLLYAKLSLGIPFTAVTLFSVSTNTLLPAFTAGLVALLLNEAAYSAEIVRAGMLSVDVGQYEAAYSVGMSPSYTLFKVVLPQAMRVIIPPMGNETISMLKNTSLLSLIAVQELYMVSTLISSQNLRQIELLVVVSCWYLFLTTVLSIPQYYVERHYARGNAKTLPPTPVERVLILLPLNRKRRGVKRTEGGAL